jgi:hypothetical protein
MIKLMVQWTIEDLACSPLVYFKSTPLETSVVSLSPIIFPSESVPSLLHKVLTFYDIMGVLPIESMKFSSH